MAIIGTFGGQTFPVIAVAIVADGNQLEVVEQEPQVQIAIGDLPTVDPHRLSAVWNNAGVITISAG